MIAIIDYGLGNPGSILNMLKKLKKEALITNNASDIEQSSHIIIPGVGSFDHGINNLEQLGLKEVLNHMVFELKKPVLGICLGLQLMCRRSEEGTKEGLAWIEADVRKFSFEKAAQQLKIPHIGWEDVNIKNDSTLFSGLEEEARFYFVHSYYVKTDHPKLVAASCQYGLDFAAACQKENVFGVQFHPEKSHFYGMQIFQNFLNM